MRYYRVGIFIAALLFTAIPVLHGQTHTFHKETRLRSNVRIPDIPGYKTLKCDFHIHTVFSDGTVWPNVRAEEAWREGLDAISVTDHIEYQPHQDDLPTNHNRSFEIAQPHGESLRLTVIRGSEVTRDMPPGHLNAIFLNDVDPVDQEDWRDSLKAAKDQGAFIFWNHPGWSGQQPDKIARWYPEHSELVEQGLLHGIEVANAREYYPEAHRWCLERGLTMLSNSDIHDPINLDYHVHEGDHRPITLVFARENSPAAIKEALFSRRTAVYTGEWLIGDRDFLRPIVEASIRLRNPSLSVKGRGSAYLQIENDSDITYHLTGGLKFDEITVPGSLDIPAGKTVLLRVRGTSRERSGRKQFTLAYTVDNLKIAPDQGLPLVFRVSVEFVPDPEEEQ